MSRTRMFDGEEPAENAEEIPGESPSPRTTIVGAQPEGDPQGAPPVPTGIQSLLRLASVDLAFREQLVTRRDAVAEAAGLELTASEQAILRAIPEAQLRHMAEELPPPPPPRREFLRQTAATAVVLLGGAAMATTLGACCGEDPIVRPNHNHMQEEGGAAPHWEEDDLEEKTSEPTPERPDHSEMQTTGGAAPDWPEEEVDTTPPPMSRGVSHDMPPKRPEKSDSAAKGGARSDYPDED